MSSEVLASAFVHPTEALLEEYCFKRVEEPALSRLEEHLLICEDCRTEVLSLDEYISLFKSAAGEWHPHNIHKPLWPAQLVLNRANIARWMDFPVEYHIPRLVGMAVTGLLLVMLGSWGWRQITSESSGSPIRVELAALRGGAPPMENSSPDALLPRQTSAAIVSDQAELARARAGRPLELVISRLSLPGAEAYRLQIVDSVGKEMWSGPAESNVNSLSASVSKRLRAGNYWVRLSSAQGELMSEYGLRME